MADNWRPLFAIAQIAGGHWPRRAFDAYTQFNPPRSSTCRLQLSQRNGAETDLSRRNGEETESTISGAGIPACHHPPSTLRSVATEDGSTQDHQLLHAIHQSFAQSGATRMTSKQLLAALHARGASTPPPSTNSLARCLRRYGIASRLMRLGTVVAKGYALTDFTVAFARHLKSYAEM